MKASTKKIVWGVVLGASFGMIQLLIAEQDWFHDHDNASAKDIIKQLLTHSLVVALDAIGGGILGFVFDKLWEMKDSALTIAAAEKHLRAASTDLQSVVDKLKSLNVEFDHLRDVSVSILGYERHSDFVRKALLTHSFIKFKNTHTIADISPTDFYELLRDCLANSQTWIGVHKGSIRLLCRGSSLGDAKDDEARSDYLTELRSATKVKKRRIFIFSDAELRELEDDALLADFWKSGGTEVKNYYVFQRDLEVKVGIEPNVIADLDDCALLDQVLLLHYRRQRKTVSFKTRRSPEAEAILRIFEIIDSINPAPFKELVCRDRSVVRSVGRP